MKATISLTHDCNLSCKYCYGGEKFPRNITLDTGMRIVDFIMDITPPGQRIEFCFFGGEPFLCFDRMKEIISYIREQQKDCENPIWLNVTSNGTILTDEIIDFLKYESIDFCVSIDGPRAIHNLNRRYKDDRGTFDDVIKNLLKAIEKLDYVQVNAVFGPETIDYLPRTVSFFTNLGVQSIHLNPNITANWDNRALNRFHDIYSEIGHHYIRQYENGSEIAINLFDSKILLAIKGGYGDNERCKMGEAEWGFAPSGNIYPCERLIGEDSDKTLCLGNIHTGLDTSRQCKLVARRGNRNEECEACSLRIYCKNSCGCTNYYLTGHVDLCSAMMCQSEKAAILVAKQILDALNEKTLFIDHFLKYIHKGRHY